MLEFLLVIIILFITGFLYCSLKLSSICDEEENKLK